MYFLLNIRTRSHTQKKDGPNTKGLPPQCFRRLRGSGYTLRCTFNRTRARSAPCLPSSAQQGGPDSGWWAGWPSNVPVKHSVDGSKGLASSHIGPPRRLYADKPARAQAGDLNGSNSYQETHHRSADAKAGLVVSMNESCLSVFVWLVGWSKRHRVSYMLLK